MIEIVDGCTGFGWVHILLAGSFECCAIHDLGGSDGALLDCLMGITHPLLWGFVVLGILLMVLCQPFYHWLKRIGLMK